MLSKLLTFFNGTIILTFSMVSGPEVPVVFCLKLKETLLPGNLSAAPVSVKAGSSL